MTRVHFAALGDVCEIRRGTTITRKQTRNGDVPVVAGGIGPSCFHDTANRTGNVISISGSGANAGYVNFWEMPIFASDCSTVEPRNDGVDARYVYFFLRSRQEDINALRSGAAQPHVYPKDIAPLQIPLPPLAEQCRIVDLLSRAEDIVRLRREAQRKAAELIPAIFLDLFGDPATNPKRWPMVTLSEVLATCDYGTSKKASLDGAGVPVLRMGNVTYAGDLDLSDLKHVELDPDELTKQALLSGDLLFNRTNSKELVGKTGIWDGRWPAVAASYFIRLRVNADCILPFYIWAVMNSRHLKRRLFATARGAIGQANINTRELKALPIALPPLDLQRQFAAKAEAMRGIAAHQTAALATAQATFDSLLHRAFAN